MGLLIGPLLVVTALGFLLGLGKALRAHIVAEAGPTHSGPTHPAEHRSR